MEITSDQCSYEQYAIISYSRKDSEAVKAEREIFKDRGVCHWIDDSIIRGENWETRFFDTLNNKNCKGIILFVSSPYLLSEQCAKEMRHFKEKHRSDDNSNGTKDPDKFCLFVLPDGYPRNDKDKIKNEVLKYAEGKTDEKTINGLKKLDDHIDLFLELNQNGKLIGGKIGNADNYIDDSCKEGKLFYKYGILDGYKGIKDIELGYFPQTQEYNDSYSKDIKDKKKRNADKGEAYYAPIDWFVIKETNKEQTLLSKKLLFAIDYLNLKYPYNKNETKTPEEWIEYHKNNNAIEEWLKDKFLDFFKPDEEKGKIKKVRFILEKEFEKIYNRCQKYANKQRELLLPEATYFAQITTRKNVHPYWLTQLDPQKFLYPLKPKEHRNEQNLMHGHA